jgi:hypothetical protein
MLTDERLAEIEARRNAATPGPWEQVNKSVRVMGTATTYAPNAYEGGICNCLGAQRLYRDKVIDDRAMANAAFIAHAPDDVADLLAEVRRLREMLDVLKPGVYTEGWELVRPNGTSATPDKWRRVGGERWTG